MEILSTRELEKIVRNNYHVVEHIYKKEEERLLDMKYASDEFLKKLKEDCNTIFLNYQNIHYTPCVVSTRLNINIARCIECPYLHNIKCRQHRDKKDEYNKNFTDFRRQQIKYLRVHRFQYNCFNEIPMFWRLEKKIKADKDYFQQLYVTKNYGYLVFEGKNYDPKNIYVADFDVLSTLLFCLERRGFSTFFML